MKFKRQYLLLIIILIASVASAQFQIKKHSINNGGKAMTGGVYSMNASIAQVDASNALTGGSYSLNGGFWHKNASTPQTELIFTNGFE